MLQDPTSGSPTPQTASPTLQHLAERSGRVDLPAVLGAAAPSADKAHQRRLEPVNLDGLGIQLEALLLVDEEFLHVLALVALQLDHLAHLRVVDDGAIARELLLDHLEDLLLVELLRQALHRRQGLAAIAFCVTLLSVDVRRRL